MTYEYSALMVTPMKSRTCPSHSSNRMMKTHLSYHCIHILYHNSYLFNLLILTPILIEEPKVNVFIINHTFSNYPPNCGEWMDVYYKYQRSFLFVGSQCTLRDRNSTLLPLQYKMLKNESENIVLL